MTLSAAAPSGHCRLTAREPWLGTPKATGITEYALRGSDEPLLAVNLHAVNFELAPTRFRSQFRALGDVLDGHTGPVIVAGDMNTWSAGRQSLVDAFMAEHGLGSVRFEDDLRTRAFGRALDHIYVRGLQAEGRPGHPRGELGPQSPAGSPGRPVKRSPGAVAATGIPERDPC